MTLPSERAAEDAGPLITAIALGAAAVAPLFVAVAIGTYALDPDADTSPSFLALVAVAFFASGAIVTTFAGTLLARTGLFRCARGYPPLVAGIVAAALVLVLPAFLTADNPGGVSLGLLFLAPVELSIALTWLAAVRTWAAVGVTLGLSLVLLVAASAAD